MRLSGRKHLLKICSPSHAHVAMANRTNLSQCSQSRVAQERSFLERSRPQGACMQCIAFYLPQFHPVPENDAVYGPGFTEWDNVRAARPLFQGHYQPHIPHKTVGWYSLLNETFLVSQHEMAFRSGITAFCYYYYNFFGHTILEKPLKIIRNNPAIRNNYCLCWAHPGWYDNRVGPQAIFVRQDYALEHAKPLYWAMASYFEDPRYITIDGKPLLLLWAPERHPHLRAYTEILRKESHIHGLPGLCLAGVEAYTPSQPESLGLDCMVEFAPNWLPENHVSPPGVLPVQIDYDKTLTFMLHKEIPPYIRLRCTFPGWDNTPRRGLHGIACVNTSLASFEYALNFLAKYTKNVLPPSFQYLFINAWNEWGEGCHLEPDIRNGGKYIHAVKKILDAYN